MTQDEILVELENASLVRVVIVDHAGAESVSIELRGNSIRQVECAILEAALPVSAPPEEPPAWDSLIVLAQAIDKKIYAATPSVRVLAREYLRLRASAQGDGPATSDRLGGILDA